MIQCLGQIRFSLLVFTLVFISTNLNAHDYPRLVKVKVGEETTFHVSDAGSCSATIWVDDIENESLFSVTPNQADGISVEFTIQANETPGETVITIQWVGEDVGSDEGSCTEDTRDSGGVQITVRVTSDKVNSIGDDATAEAGDGHCDTGNNVEIDGEDVPECTLRAAIEEVNAGGWEGVVEFDIPGPEPHLIKPESALPAVEKQTVITGFGVGSGKLNQIQNRVPTIILDGSANESPANGLVINASASGTLIEGLSLIGFGGHGIVILADEVIVKSNYIGTDPGGSINQGNEKSGIFINEGVGNQIGGNSPDDRNIISGNFDHGVEINSGSLNRILGNWIGLKPDSSGVIGNKKSGVQVNEGTNHAIGAFTDTPGMAPGNVISGNKDGLFIDSNEIFVRGNVIGDTQTDPEVEKIYANTNSGITVEGNTISIGGTNENEANVIAGNGGTGVIIQNDETRFVSVRGNQIYNNGQLGIDIMDSGVTENDSLDVDLGPNGRLNYPEIKYVKTAEPFVDGSEVEVRGKLYSGSNATFEIDIYMSDSCDDSKYGEGQTYLGKTSVSTNAEGNGSFMFKFISSGDKTYDENKSITAITATHTGSTSEFSRCPRPTLLLVDAEDNPMKEKKFAFFKIADNKPIYSETFIDSLETDEDGIIYKDSINAEHEDRVLVRRNMRQERSNKAVPATKTKYTITLDNIHFLAGGELEFFKLDTNKTSQKTKLDHTTIAYNLAISIEWNASSAYVQDLQNSLRLASNYFYNVSDGQMRLDTVSIFKSKASWNNVDVRYHASNVQWPMATVNGINQILGSSKVYMPRRWFGNANANRNLSVVAENALNLTHSHEYRTLIHEFGHYGLGLFDEYEFVIGTRCVPGYRYGFMDAQYAGENFSNEMSTAAHYILIGCRNNKQFINHGMSTSNFVKRLFDQIIDEVKVPYFIANDRDLAPDQFVYPGPNENFASLSYDVGNKILFPRAVSNSPYSTYIFTVINNEGNALPRARVYHKTLGGGYVLYQGESADNGRMAVLGHAAGDSLFIFAPAPPPAGSKLIAANDEIEWYSAITTSNEEEITLGKISGLRPILPDLNLTSSGFVVDIITSTQASALPNVRAVTDNIEEPVSVSLTGNGFRMTHQLDGNQSGYFSIRAQNLQGQNFMFNTPFRYEKMENDEKIQGIGAVNGDFYAEISDSLASFSKVLILSSDFPVPEVGLEENAIKVSSAHALQYEFVDESTPFGINIGYNDGYLESTDEELSVKIFRWDSNEDRWKQMGGQVDTLHNVVSTTVAEPGIYAAFTSTTTTSIERNPSEMPEQFRLHQNYPNPFNPTTTIPFDVAEATHVKLTVYDLLGREVITLVNEQKSAGSYSVIFNSGRLSSGVYLYRIEMGQFSDTRRMMLVK